MKNNIRYIGFAFKHWIKYIRDISSAEKITIPKVFVMPAGTTQSVEDAKVGTIHVMGFCEDDTNGGVLMQDITPVDDKSFAYDPTAKTITVSNAEIDAPTQYLVRYDREVKPGIKLIWSLAMDEFKLAYKLAQMRDKRVV